MVLCLLAPASSSTRVVVPAAPRCQTAGEGPDSVLCAPGDKLSLCQTSAGHQSAAIAAQFDSGTGLWTEGQVLVLTLFLQMFENG